MNTKLSNPVEYNLVNLLLNLSRSLDFSNVGIMDHHKKVAFIALNLGHKAGLPDQQLMELFKVAIIHDIGAVNHRDKVILQKFDVNKPWAHCEKGSSFVAGIPDLDSARLTIYCHHDRWAGENPSGLTGNSIPLNSRIIHLADRVDVLLNHERYILEQNKEIIQRIGQLSGKVFDPELYDILVELGKQESFWLDLVSPWIEDCMLELIPTSMASVRRDNLMTVARLFARVVDDRSSFTYRHSVYVSQVCRVLATHAGLSEDDCYLLQIAGLLHDLGKMAVPEDIIEKPGKLTDHEYSIVKQHSYYTYWLLNPVLPGQAVPSWAAYHHERLDGNGYPFKKTADEIDLPARIVAVADIFTALREDRPYRPGLSYAKIEAIMKEEVTSGGLDEEVVTMLFDCRQELDEIWSTLSLFGVQ
jgi:HD-GYP domain-containing protein (c-di-GMP phosphodiesterase class II)